MFHKRILFCKFSCPLRTSKTIYFTILTYWEINIFGVKFVYKKKYALLEALDNTSKGIKCHIEGWDTSHIRLQ